MTDDDGALRRILALEKAIEVTQERARVRWLAMEGGDVMEAITSPACHNCFVMDVLCWQPYVGPVAAKRTLTQLMLPMTVRCGDLTPRQLDVLSRWRRAGARERDAIANQEQRRWREGRRAA